MPGRRTRRIRPPAGNFQVNAAKTGPRSHRKIIGKVVSAGDGTIFCGDLILTLSSFEQAMTSPSSLPASTPACRQSGSPARQGIWPASARRRSSRVALVPLETQAFKQTRPREHDDELNPKSHTVPSRGERPCRNRYRLRNRLGCRPSRAGHRRRRLAGKPLPNRPASTGPGPRPRAARPTRRWANGIRSKSENR
jgi:hypothetical protein